MFKRKIRKNKISIYTYYIDRYQRHLTINQLENIHTLVYLCIFIELFILYIFFKLLYYKYNIQPLIFYILHIHNVSCETKLENISINLLNKLLIFTERKQSQHLDLEFVSKSSQYASISRQLAYNHAKQIAKETNIGRKKVKLQFVSTGYARKHRFIIHLKSTFKVHYPITFYEYLIIHLPNHFNNKIKKSINQFMPSNKR